MDEMVGVDEMIWGRVDLTTSCHVAGLIYGWFVDNCPVNDGLNSWNRYLDELVCGRVWYGWLMDELDRWVCGRVGLMVGLWTIARSIMV